MTDTTEPAKPSWRQHPIRTTFGILAALFLLIILATLDDAGSTAEPQTFAGSNTDDQAADTDADMGEIGITEEPTPTPEPTPEPEPEPAPDAEYTSACDLLLFVDGDNSEFAATTDIENTGNVGVIVDVTASFDQLGRDDYKLRKDGVKIPVGKSKTVNLSETIGTDVVDRHQSGGYECEVEVEAVDTFGAVQD